MLELQLVASRLLAGYELSEARKLECGGVGSTARFPAPPPTSDSQGTEMSMR